MNVVDVHLHDAGILAVPARVGRLFRDSSRRGDVVRFEYEDAWLAAPFSFEIEPLMPLREGPFHAAKAGELPHIFEDCAPDRWGRLLMDRREAIESRGHGRTPRTLRNWDYLLGVDDATRMGALRLVDPATGDYVASQQPRTPPITSLRELEAAARAFEEGNGEDLDRQVRQLIAPGGSLGGARPKASFIDETGELWLAKFPSTEDRHDVGLWEFATWELACMAGIRMPEARLLSLSTRGHTFAARRFDRAGNARRTFASALTLLDMDSDGASYLDLATAVETQGAHNAIAAGLEQLFRRAVFNVLVGNRDDHLRNHGFLRESTGWVLSPAFDVNPNPHKDVHVLALDAVDPTPDTDLLLAQHAFFRLDGTRAANLVEQVRDATRQWESVARRLGARTQELALMATVIDPER